MTVPARGAATEAAPDPAADGSVLLWRIAAETRRHGADDLSGAGAVLYPGRWNDIDQPVVYTATSMALAVLETVAHLDDGGLPLNRFLVEIRVPAAAWAAREALAAADLPATWAAIPAGRASVRLGSAWLASRRSPLLVLPSAVLPEERVALVNPAHPLAAGITARVLRRFEYRRVLRG